MINYNELLKTEDILQLLSTDLNFSLKKVGKNFVMLCPFHDDKSPSLNFVANEGFFKCFSCSFKAGNIFSFWAQYKKINLSQTVKEVSKLGYFPLPEELSEKVEKKNKKKEFLTFFSLTKDIYHYNLFTLLGKEIFDYLTEKRKITKQLVEKFFLGCTINNKQLNNLLLHPQNNFSHPQLLLTNLIQVVSNSQVYDFFYPQQLIIPLANEKGEIVAFASRKLNNQTQHKYNYLPNHPYYKKSSLLYNYFSVSQRSEWESCYLVEGFFDVISLSKLGIDNCLASLGTDLSEEQIILLQRLNKKIVLFLDGDQAGKKATVNMIISLLKKDIDCEVIKHSYQHDPDELVINKEEEIKKILKTRENPYLFIINYYCEKEDISKNPQRVPSFINEIAKSFVNFKQSIHNFLIKNISKVINWEETEVKEIYFAPQPITVEEVPVSEPFSLVSHPREKIKETEKLVLKLCAHDRRFWLWWSQQNYFFLLEENRYFYQKIYNFYTASPKNFCYKQEINNQSDFFIYRQKTINDLCWFLQQYTKVYKYYKQLRLWKKN